MEWSKEELAYLRLYPPRRAEAHKGNYGRLLLIAGSPGMSGAAFLAATAAYRCGAGMVKILTHEANRVILQTQIPEALMSCYSGAEPGGEQLEALVERELAWSDSCVIGPGLGRTGLSSAVLSAAVKALRRRAAMSVQSALTGEQLQSKAAAVPLQPTDTNAQPRMDAVRTQEPYLCLLDADALNLLAQGQGMLSADGLFRELKDRMTVVLTPHMAEMQRLSGLPLARLKADAAHLAAAYARAHGVLLVMKDSETVVTDGAALYRHAVPCAALAKAGSGDVLAGALAGLWLSCRAAFVPAAGAEAGLTGAWLPALDAVDVLTRSEQLRARLSASEAADVLTRSEQLRAQLSSADTASARACSDMPQSALPLSLGFLAAVLAVILHSGAGRIGAELRGEHALLARETADFLAQAQQSAQAAGLRL